MYRQNGGQHLLLCSRFDQTLPTILPIMPERVETFIFTITSLMNAFTVLGLISMRSAISLLVRPSSKSSTVSCSRAVRLKRSEISAIVTASLLCRSSMTSINLLEEAERLTEISLRSRGNDRQRYFRLAERNSPRKPREI